MPPSGQQLVLILDRTQATARHRVPMLGLRVGERALPPAWRVRQTRGSIGLAEQDELARLVAAWLPAGAGAVPMGDRFRGAPDPILPCRALGWDHRFRLGGDLLVTVEGGETTTGECAGAAGISCPMSARPRAGCRPASPSFMSRGTPSPGSSP